MNDYDSILAGNERRGWAMVLPKQNTINADNRLADSIIVPYGFTADVDLQNEFESFAMNSTILLYKDLRTAATVLLHRFSTISPSAAVNVGIINYDAEIESLDTCIYITKMSILTVLKRKPTSFRMVTSGSFCPTVPILDIGTVSSPHDDSDFEEVIFAWYENNNSTGIRYLWITYADPLTGSLLLTTVSYRLDKDGLLTTALFDTEWEERVSHTINYNGRYTYRCFAVNPNQFSVLVYPSNPHHQREPQIHTYDKLTRTWCDTTIGNLFQKHADAPFISVYNNFKALGAPDAKLYWSVPDSRLLCIGAITMRSIAGVYFAQTKDGILRFQNAPASSSAIETTLKFKSALSLFSFYPQLTADEAGHILGFDPIPGIYSAGRM